MALDAGFCSQRRTGWGGSVERARKAPTEPILPLPLHDRQPLPCRPASESTRQRHGLSREGSGNTRQRHCLSHGGSTSTRRIQMSQPRTQWEHQAKAADPHKQPPTPNRTFVKRRVWDPAGCSSLRLELLAVSQPRGQFDHLRPGRPELPDHCREVVLRPATAHSV